MKDEGDRGEGGEGVNAQGYVKQFFRPVQFSLLVHNTKYMNSKFNIHDKKLFYKM